MSRTLKLITALLSIIFCFSVCTLAVAAVDMDGDGYDDDTGELIVVATEEPPVVVDPTDYIEPEPTYVEPEPEPTYVEPEPEPTYYEEPNDNNYDYNNGDDYNNDYNSGYSSSYVGGGQTYVEPVSTAPSAPLYNSDHKIDDNELNSNDWDEIAANLKNASSSDSDAEDFSFIQNNDSQNDNGEWILIAGIICLILSACGIIYVIASAVMRRKKVSPGAASSAKRPAYAAANVSGHYRSNDDYDDGYRTPTKKEQKKLSKSRRFDTADVQLPKSSQTTKNKSGGKRYK